VFTTVLNLVSESAAAEDGFSWVQVVTVLVAFAVAWPLLTRLRRTLSERRRARWSEQEPTTPTDESRHPD
jgi:hypothetical protein